MPVPTRLTRRFLLHYLEMVAVMFAGMGVLALRRTGCSARSAPAGRSCATTRRR